MKCAFYIFFVVNLLLFPACISFLGKGEFVPPGSLPEYAGKKQIEYVCNKIITCIILDSPLAKLKKPYLYCIPLTIKNKQANDFLNILRKKISQIHSLNLSENPNNTDFYLSIDKFEDEKKEYKIHVIIKNKKDKIIYAISESLKKRSILQ
ncbi:MAG: hypothetical protein U9O87_07785 [Verrucomicrobiota bacterium]|nr:hypothetical protein [Verrucomicrobiota bacterium]